MNEVKNAKGRLINGKLAGIDRFHVEMVKKNVMDVGKM